MKAISGGKRGKEFFSKLLVFIADGSSKNVSAMSVS